MQFQLYWHSDSDKYRVLKISAGVTMTLFCTHGRVSGPNSLLDLRGHGPPADTVSHVNFDQWSGDMAVGSCGLEAILA